MDKEAIAYFERFVKYSRRGINGFLKSRLNRAGFLLMMIMSGIDTLGGICYGFERNNSRARSVRFMQKNMGIHKSLAGYLYSVVRCGIAHQGMPKLGLQYFVEYNRLDKGKSFYRDFKDEQICMNVAEFAYSYLEVVERISAKPDEYVRFYPTLDENEKNAFNEAIELIKDDIRDFWRKTEKHKIRRKTLEEWIEDELDEDKNSPRVTTTSSQFQE